MELKVLRTEDLLDVKVGHTGLTQEMEDLDFSGSILKTSGKSEQMKDSDNRGHVSLKDLNFQTIDRTKDIHHNAGAQFPIVHQIKSPNDSFEKRRILASNHRFFLKRIGEEDTIQRTVPA